MRPRHLPVLFACALLTAGPVTAIAKLEAQARLAKAHLSVEARRPVLEKRLLDVAAAQDADTVAFVKDGRVRKPTETLMAGVNALPASAAKTELMAAAKLHLERVVAFEKLCLDNASYWKGLSATLPTTHAEKAVQHQRFSQAVALVPTSPAQAKEQLETAVAAMKKIHARLRFVASEAKTLAGKRGLAWQTLHAEGKALIERAARQPALVPAVQNATALYAALSQYQDGSAGQVAAAFTAFSSDSAGETADHDAVALVLAGPWD